MKNDPESFGKLLEKVDSKKMSVNYAHQMVKRSKYNKQQKHRIALIEKEAGQQTTTIPKV